jgi:hypothetical protein
MPIGHTKEYYVRCENYAREGRTFEEIRNCYGGGYESHDRSEVIRDALSAGWLRMGKLWYCPWCKHRMENRNDTAQSSNV